MFDLDQAIAEWRRRMLAGGVKNQNVLDELESHLREDVARQVQSGLSAEQVFEPATRQIGEAHALKTEFAKAGRNVMGRACIVFLVGLILFFSGETILHLQMSLGEQMTAFVAVVFTLVVACGWRYAAPFLPVDFIRQKVLAVGSECGFYFKASAFLMPAALVWLLTVVALMPKLQELCHAAGMTIFKFDGRLGDAPATFKVWATIGQAMVFLMAHDLSIGGAVVLAFILLEWRSRGWRRYRRVTVGAGIFVFNFAVLLSLMFMVISALIASSSIMSHVK